MSDEIWTRAEPESPCVKLCQIHPEARICIGCLRSMDEIAGWSRMDRTTRQDVLDALPARAPLLQKRRGGRQRTRPSAPGAS